MGFRNSPSCLPQLVSELYMLLLLLVELLFPSCIAAEPYFQDVSKNTSTFMTTLWGSRNGAHQSTHAQDIWPQLIP